MAGVYRVALDASSSLREATITDGIASCRQERFEWMLAISV